jgi:hypothetical protein
MKDLISFTASSQPAKQVDLLESLLRRDRTGGNRRHVGKRGIRAAIWHVVERGLPIVHEQAYRTRQSAIVLDLVADARDKRLDCRI